MTLTTIRSVAYAGLLAILAAPVALAQDGPPGPGGPPGFGGDPTEGITRFLRSELDLDDGQVDQVRPIVGDSMSELMTVFMESFDPATGGIDQDKVRSAIEDLRVSLADKIRPVLDPFQKKEFDFLVEQFDQRAAQFEQQERAYKEPRMTFEPPPDSKRILLAKARRSLFLPPDELAVIMPFVEAVIDAKIELAETKRVRRKDLLNALAAEADEKEIKERVKTIRAGEKRAMFKLVTARQALRELLTLEQEVRFVALDILD